MNKNYIIVDNRKIEATEDDKVLIDGYPLESVHQIETVLSMLIKAIVSIAN